MNSFLACISQNAALSPREITQLTNEYNDYVKQYTRTMGSQAAAEMAAQKLTEVSEHVLTKKRENMIRGVLKRDEIKRDVYQRAAVFKNNKEIAATRRMGWTYGNPTAMAAREFIENVATRHEALKREVTNAIWSEVEKYRAKKAGLTQKSTEFKEIVRALQGEKVDDPEIMHSATAIRKVFDLLHRRYSMAGGIMGKLENYFPQTHDARAVGNAGFEAWRNKITPLLDRERMIDPATGLPFTDQKLAEVIKEVFEGIKTNGLNDIADRLEEGKVTQGRGAGLTLKHNKSRFFHFEDADSFFKYNAEFGYGDSGLFDAMMGHIETMTRDISILEHMGPNPQTTVDMLKLMQQVDGAGRPQTQKTLQGMYNIMAGRLSYNGQVNVMYRALEGLQNLKRSALLGSAPISSLNDYVSVRHAALMNGLPANVAMGHYFKLLNPLDGNDRSIAKRIGFIANSVNGNTLVQGRWGEDLGSHGLTGWLATFTVKASGLDAMGNATRNSIALGAMGHLAHLAENKAKWADLPPALKEAFDRWKIEESDFDNIMKAEAWKDDESGATFITSDTVAAAGHLESANKLDMWISDMQKVASNEGNLLVRAITSGAWLGDAQRGTALRAASSSLMMFKSFTTSILINHLLPSLRHAGSTGNFQRVAVMFMASTVLGAADLQARQYINGKTSMDATKPKFWMAAMAQGGGAGIFGEFLFQDYSRFGNSAFVTLAGPIAGTVDDVARIFKGNFDRAIDEDQEANFLGDVYSMASRNIPGAKLWYTRLLLERLILDQGARALDSGYDSRIQNLERNMQKKTGNEFWWEPGQVLPNN